VVLQRWTRMTVTLRFYLVIIAAHAVDAVSYKL